MNRLRNAFKVGVLLLTAVALTVPGIRSDARIPETNQRLALAAKAKLLGTLAASFDADSGGIAPVGFGGAVSAEQVEAAAATLPHDYTGAALHRDGTILTAYTAQSDGGDVVIAAWVFQLPDESSSDLPAPVKEWVTAGGPGAIGTWDHVMVDRNGAIVHAGTTQATGDNECHCTLISVVITAAKQGCNLIPNTAGKYACKGVMTGGKEVADELCERCEERHRVTLEPISTDGYQILPIEKEWKCYTDWRVTYDRYAPPDLRVTLQHEFNNAALDQSAVYAINNEAWFLARGFYCCTSEHRLGDMYASVTFPPNTVVWDEQWVLEHNHAHANCYGRMEGHP